VQLEPGGGLKAFRQGGAGMSSFFQVVGQKPGDQWVVIDDKEIDAIAIEDFHRQKLPWRVSFIIPRIVLSSNLAMWGRERPGFLQEAPFP
jgi:hypothetical protein